MISLQDLQISYNSGRNMPTIDIPDLTCDCHHHIYDPSRFPYVLSDTRNQPPARVEEYRLVKKKLGIKRSVIVTPSAYGTDNRCTIDAMKQLGTECTRAVVVIDDGISDKILTEWHDLGVRGVRFNISRGGTTDTYILQRLIDRISTFDWHAEFWMPPETLVDLGDFLRKQTISLVFDHRGHLPKVNPTGHKAFSVIQRFLESGQGWVCLSGLYMDHDYSLKKYEDTVNVGKILAEINPDRIIWGTDWPHPIILSEGLPWPDDAQMLDLLLEQVKSEKNLVKALVTNPAELYGF